MTSDRTLPRRERLRTMGAVRRLFAEGRSGFVYPFRYLWFAEADTEPSVEVLFSVPKRHHKRANRRNLLRRRTKEAYRLQKELLTHRVETLNLDLALVYTATDLLPSAKIAHAVRKILETIAAQL